MVEGGQVTPRTARFNIVGSVSYDHPDSSTPC
jgi:hypothetical protein